MYLRTWYVAHNSVEKVSLLQIFVTQQHCHDPTQNTQAVGIDRQDTMVGWPFHAWTALTIYGTW